MGPPRKRVSGTFAAVTAALARGRVDSRIDPPDECEHCGAERPAGACERCGQRPDGAPVLDMGNAKQRAQARVFLACAEEDAPGT